MPNLNKTLIAFLFILGSHLTSAYGQVPPDCSLTSPANTLTNNSACYFQPQERIMTIYSIYLCSAAPTAPTTSSAIGIPDTTCILAFNNPNGAQAIINSTTAASPPNLAGNTATVKRSKLPISTSHVYVEFSPVSTTQAKQQFANSQTGTDSTTGTYCWTTTNTMFVLSSNPPGSSCASSPPIDAGVQTEKLNSLGGTGPFLANFSFNNRGPNLDVTADAYLLTTDKKLATATADSMGSISILGAVYRLPSTINIGEKGYKPQINFTWGAEAFRSGLGKTFIEGGPLTVQFLAN
jgi:hypothetical protein